MSGEHVTLVVDPEYGERASARAKLPLWVIASPKNTPVIERLWASGERYGANAPATFDAVSGRSAEDSAIAFIDTVDMHHPDWPSFEIVGVRSTPKLVNALLEYASGSAVETQTGLVFSRDGKKPQEVK
jgi:hypothetical protein